MIEILCLKEHFWGLPGCHFCLYWPCGIISPERELGVLHSPHVCQSSFQRIHAISWRLRSIIWLSYCHLTSLLLCTVTLFGLCVYLFLAWVDESLLHILSRLLLVSVVNLSDCYAEASLSIEWDEKISCIVLFSDDSTFQWVCKVRLQTLCSVNLRKFYKNKLNSLFFLLGW